MRRIGRIIKWSALGLGLLLALVVVAAAIYLRTEHFSLWLRQQLIAAINESIRGSVAVERLEGSVWGKLAVYDLTLRDDRAEIVKFPRVTVSFSLLPLIVGRLQVEQIETAQAQARLVQDKRGAWNLIEALSPRRPEPDSSGALSVSVGSFKLSESAIEVRLAGGKSYRLKEFNLRGDLALRPAGLAANLQEVASLLSAEGQPEMRLKGGFDYRQEAALPGVLNVKELWAVSRNSRVKVNGQITLDDSVKISAQAKLEKLAPADVAYFAPAWRLKHDIVGALAITGTIDALRGDLELSAAGATINGKFLADVSREQPRYTAQATLNGFDLRRWLDDHNLAGIVSGTVEAGGDGFALAQTKAKALLDIRAAEARGWSLGVMSLDGRMQQGVAAIDGELKSKLGGASWSGKVTLDDRRPTYALALSVRDLDVEKTVGSGAAAQGRLNFQANLKGAGLTLADMDTRVELRLQPSTLGPIKMSRGELNAVVSGKRIRIARATLATAETTLSAAGEIGLDAMMGGKLDYRLRVADIQPWLALIEREGSGALDLAGVARGDLADLKTEGRARLSGLRMDGVAVRDGDIKFALQGSKGQTLPQGEVRAYLQQVEAGLSLRRLDASATLVREPKQTVQFTISAQDGRNRKHSLSGSLAFASEGPTLRVTQASLALPDGLWKLARPATLSQRGEALLLDPVMLRNGAQELSLRGTVGFSGRQNLTLQAAAIPLNTLSEFLPRQPEMTGLIGLTAQIGGTAAAPEITASMNLSAATIAGQPYAGSSAEGSYRDQRVNLRVAVRQDAAHTLNGAGTLPLQLSWHNGFHAEVFRGLDFRVQSAGISLGFLNAFSGKSVEAVGGEVTLDMVARGSLAAPELSGQFRLRDGKAKVLPIGVEISSITLAGSLASQVLTLGEFSAKANGGELRGRGALALKDYDIGGFKLALNARRWPAIDTQRHQVKVAGEIEVQGTLAAPRITGQLEVVEGSLRPDLAFLEVGKVPLKRDETIVVVKKTRPERLPAAQKSERAAVADSAYFKKLSLDLRLRAPGNLWIRHPELLSEISGAVLLRKAPNRELDLAGQIEMARGWFAFQSRRFELARGTIEFTGGETINPALDILAQYRLPQYQVNAIIGGTAEKPTLTLASTPQLEQADILALLIFGKPMAALNQNEQGSLQQSALSITGGYVAGRIASSVSEALGLDTLGVDVREVDFSGGRVGFGRYFGRDTYVSVSQELTGERGREVSVEYQVAPDWKIGTSTTSTGSNGIDVIWHKRY